MQKYSVFHPFLGRVWVLFLMRNDDNTQGEAFTKARLVTHKCRESTMSPHTNPVENGTEHKSSEFGRI